MSAAGSYPPNAPEAISRRLADFTFMLRDYKAATGIYDSIRRDYIQDGAVKLGASATVGDFSHAHDAPESDDGCGRKCTACPPSWDSPLLPTRNHPPNRNNNLRPSSKPNHGSSRPWWRTRRIRTLGWMY